MQMFDGTLEDVAVKLGNYTIIDWAKVDPLRPYAESPREILYNITQETLQNAMKKDPTVTLPQRSPNAKRRAYYVLVGLDEFDDLGNVKSRSFLPNIKTDEATVIEYNEKGEPQEPKVVAITQDKK